MIMSEELSRGPSLRGHIPALDSLRGLAILMVLGYHFSDFSGVPGVAAQSVPAPLMVLREGSYGVDLFFVLSGFLITGILHDTKGTAHYFRNFYVRRALRILPLYWGVLLATFWLLPLATGMRPYAHTAEHQVWLWFFGTNLFQAWMESWYLPGFNHFWSLAVEEHFYLVWPVVIFCCSRRMAMAVCVECIVAAVLLRLVLTVQSGHAVAAYVLTPCRMDALALGALLALAARGPNGVGAVRRPIYAAGFAAALLLAVLYRVPGLPETLAALQTTLYALVFGAVLVGAVLTEPGTRAGRFWNSRFLRFFGKYSYGLYVFHFLLRPLFYEWFPVAELTRWTASPFLGRLLFLVAATGATVLVSLASWHLFEKHFLRLKEVFARPPQAQAEPSIPLLVG